MISRAGGGFGPPATPLPAIPSWVPAAGQAASYTGGGAVLTNNCRAVVDPTAIGFSLFNFSKTTDYSGLFLHPTWRTYGGWVGWGGGHSTSNYCGAWMVTPKSTTIEFECLLTSFAWTGGVLDTGDNSAQCNSYSEATGSSPLRKAGPHSYGCGAVVAGKFVDPYPQALGYSNWASIQAAHELDLTDPSVAPQTRAWVRRTATIGSMSPANAPTLSCYVPAQNRQFFARRGGGSPFNMAWFDHGSNTWVEGSGTGFNYAEGSVDIGALVHVPSRDLLLCCYRVSGNLVIQYANVASGVSQPALGGTATLSASLAIPDAWGAIGWCSHSSRLQVFGVVSNTDKVYEIDIPSTLSNTWTVDTAGALPGGATIVPRVTSTWGLPYNELCRVFLFLPNGLVDTGNDVVQAYRPRNT